MTLAHGADTFDRDAMRDGPTQEINLPDEDELRGWVDAVIVGAGPAGLSAAAAIASRGLDAVVIESQKVAGGQPRWLYPSKRIADVPGLPPGTQAADFAAALYRSAVDAGAVFRFGEILIDVQDSETDEGGEPLARVLTSKRVYYARRVILALGLRHYPRRLPILDRLESRRVSYGVPWVGDFDGAKVVVVGRDALAVDAALIVAARNGAVDLVMLDERRTHHRPLLDRLEAEGGTLHLGCELTGADRDGDSLDVELSSGERIVCDQVIVQLGHLPARDLFERLELEVDADGAVPVGPDFLTSRPMIYAIGEVAGAAARIAVACGQGVQVVFSAFGPAAPFDWTVEPAPLPAPPEPLLAEFPDDSESSVDDIDSTRR